ncbi:hypothetical protein BHE74_00024674 [Ensete ventricosum]|nr:hypothetical protein GW17_00017856 [Ensete ventricosum]RWW67849.1 hypothetical protein BHE74_00024674 [Ensete ventricosum]
MRHRLHACSHPASVRENLQIREQLIPQEATRALTTGSNLAKRTSEESSEEGNPDLATGRGDSGVRRNEEHERQ